ncbi:MAG: hypothetical protein IH948_05740 [Bacteroidetes bacterium]|nr:hypothetical protein [Bacteroidota bacterium]
MKWLKSTWILVFFSVQVVAQNFGNEWINYASTYYKIKVPVTGVYRIDSAALAGLTILSQDPRKFQLFNKGKEVKIHIEGEGDGKFNTNDYLEFYGEKNDGWLDTTLYYQNSDQTDAEYSLFNDTAVYFLTWNSSLTNQRITLETDTVFGSYTPIDSVFKNELVNYNGEYYNGDHVNDATDAKYSDSEGWFDFVLDKGSTVKKNINVTKRDTNGTTAIVNISIVGQSKDFTFPPTQDDHRLQIQFGNVTIDDTYKGYVAKKYSRTLPTADLTEPTTEFIFKSIFNLGAASDRNAIASIQIIYPVTLDLNNNSSFEMIVPENPSESKSLLNITNFNNSGTVYIYNTTDNTRIEAVVSGTNVSALISNSGGDKECIVISEGDIINVSSVDLATTTGKFTDYAATTLDSAYVIVTHQSIISSAMAYATYRGSIAGGSHSTLVVDIEELYDQYAYGIAKHPMSIRNFMRNLINIWPNDPHYLFLIGKSISAHEIRTDPSTYAKVLVPTIGNPAADIMFTSGLNGTLYEPYIPTGRLSAKNSAEVDLYLNKIIEYETPQATPQEWMKKILHFGGGTSAAEQIQFKGYLKSYENILENPAFGGQVTTFLKTSTEPIQITSTEIIKNLIDNGVTLMTFFGHGSTNGFDQGIDDVTTFSNKGKYPFILSNSCYNGNIHTKFTGASEDFTLIANVITWQLDTLASEVVRAWYDVDTDT